MNDMMIKRKLRGKALKPFCKNAHMSKYKQGDDVTMFCYGLYKNDWQIEVACPKCKAFVDNIISKK